MEKNRTIKTIAVVALMVAIVGMGVAFAALSTTLNLTGQAKVNAPDWNVKFENLGTAIETGDGLADGTPTLTVTTISNVKATFDGNGSVAYEFDVTNTGILDAKIGTFTLAGTPTCTGSGTNKLADETLVCGAISTTLKYKTGGANVAANDTLDSGETKRMVFTINYNAGASHPDMEVNVTGLNATITYIEN